MSKIDSIVRSRGFTIGELASSTGLSQEVVRSYVVAGEVLPARDAKRLADALHVPAFVLYGDRSYPFMETIDFRATVPSIKRLDDASLAAISYVEHLIDFLIRNSVEAELKFTPISVPNSSPRTLSEHWRSLWNFTHEAQLSSRGALETYRSLRAFIERTGIMVMQLSIESRDVSGFYCNISGFHPLIVVNTWRQSRGRRLFTLAHELCHAILAAPGISNYSSTSNDVEQFCNKFAANLLAPESLISQALSKTRTAPSINSDFVRLFSNRIGISQEATVLRLSELGIFSRDEYREWKLEAEKRNIEVDEENVGGRAPADPIRDKKAKYGALFLELSTLAAERNELSGLDLYRGTRIKPKYQRLLFGAQNA